MIGRGGGTFRLNYPSGFLKNRRSIWHSVFIRSLNSLRRGKKSFIRNNSTRQGGGGKTGSRELFITYACARCSFNFEPMERKTWAVYIHRDFIMAKRRAETRELLVTHAGSLARFVQKVNDLCSLYWIDDTCVFWVSCLEHAHEIRTQYGTW
jgi:hypothetical protein